MPKPDNLPSALIVSGGKQYRVTPGARILVDRLSSEPGSSVKLGRVLLFSDGEGVKVGNPAVDGVDVDAKVIAHRRGPRIESIRYKSKKRVRVHTGGRAHLTALEIIAVGGVGLPKPEEEETEKPAAKKPRGKKPAATKAEAKAEPVEETEAPAKKKATATRRRAKKESE